MCPVICIASHKGGVGKTTVAINLSSALAVAEKRTLLVDCDPQGNATTGMGIDKAAVKKTLYDVLMGNAVAEEIILDSQLGFLKVVPADIELVHAGSRLNSMPKKETVLQGMLAGVREAYDYVIIDSPPSLNILATNAMCAADSLLIPLQCEFYALEGLGQLLHSFKAVQRRFNPLLRVAGILLTMVDEGEAICRKIVAEVRKNFKDQVFKTMILRDVKLRESPCFGKPLLLLDIMSAGALSYLQLARELMAQGPPAAAPRRKPIGERIKQHEDYQF